MTLFVVALPAEARPVIDHWRLQRLTRSHAFPVYRDTSASVWLVVCGLGKVNVAAACAHLYNYCGAKRHAVWVNVGIAGHATQALGTPLLIHAAAETSSDRTHYPPLLFSINCQSSALLTVDRATREYPSDCAVDMEGSAFFSVAARYSPAELVQSLKVVSDNNCNSPESVSPQNATRWLSDNIELIEHLEKQLHTLAAQVEARECNLPECLQKLRFTFSQQQQCKELVRRWRVVSEGKTLPCEHFATVNSAREALIVLQNLLARQPHSYT